MSSYDILQKEIVELFIQNWNVIKGKTYVAKEQSGKGSYHSAKDFEEIMKVHPVTWDKNISEYKEETNSIFIL